MLLDNNSI